MQALRSAATFEREEAAWARLKPLIKTERQRFAVLKDDGLVALFEDLLEAMNYGEDRFGPRNFLLASVFPEFTRGGVTPCQL